MLVFRATWRKARSRQLKAARKIVRVDGCLLQRDREKHGGWVAAKRSRGLATLGLI